METQKINNYLLSISDRNPLITEFKEIQKFISDENGNSEKEKLSRFKFKLRKSFENLGIRYEFISDKEIRWSMPVEKKKAIAIKPEPIKIETKKENLLENSTSNQETDFGHQYIFPKQFSFVKKALETEGCYPLLVGNRSSGKSRMCEEIAKRSDRHDEKGNVIGKGIPCYRICLEEIEESADLVGYTSLVADPVTQTSQTIFVPGILLEAWANGWVLIMDEIDRASKAARKQLNMVTEQGGKLMVPTHQGFKFYEKHPDAKFIFTANTWGYGDLTGMYEGAEPINSAWLSRIGPKFEIKIDWDVFKEVLRAYSLPENVINYLFEKDAGVVQSMQSTIDKNGLNETITLRSFIRFAKLFPVFGWNYGLEVCVINEFSETNRERMREVISQKLGLKFKPCDEFKENPF